MNNMTISEDGLTLTMTPPGKRYGSQEFMGIIFLSVLVPVLLIIILVMFEKILQGDMVFFFAGLLLLTLPFIALYTMFIPHILIINLRMGQIKIKRWGKFNQKIGRTEDIQSIIVAKNEYTYTYRSYHKRRLYYIRRTFVWTILLRFSSGNPLEIFSSRDQIVAENLAKQLSVHINKPLSGELFKFSSPVPGIPFYKKNRDLSGISTGDDTVEWEKTVDGYLIKATPGRVSSGPLTASWLGLTVMILIWFVYGSFLLGSSGKSREIIQKSPLLFLIIVLTLIAVGLIRRFSEKNKNKTLKIWINRDSLNIKHPDKEDIFIPIEDILDMEPQKEEDTDQGFILMTTRNGVYEMRNCMTYGGCVFLCKEIEDTVFELREGGEQERQEELKSE